MRRQSLELLAEPLLPSFRALDRVPGADFIRDRAPLGLLLKLYIANAIQIRGISSRLVIDTKGTGDDVEDPVYGDHDEHAHDTPEHMTLSVIVDLSFS